MHVASHTVLIGRYTHPRAFTTFASGSNLAVNGSTRAGGWSPPWSRRKAFQCRFKISRSLASSSAIKQFTTAVSVVLGVGLLKITTSSFPGKTAYETESIISLHIVCKAVLTGHDFCFLAAIYRRPSSHIDRRSSAPRSERRNGGLQFFGQTLRDGRDIRS